MTRPTLYPVTVPSAMRRRIVLVQTLNSAAASESATSLPLGTRVVARRFVLICCLLVV
ncbi:hypothetical protein [Georgenia yuyongxinii]